jgi:glutamine amidotransferase
VNVVVVRYNAGNIQSVRHALGRLGIEPDVTDDPGSLRAADRVIFPGVGEASSAMRYLAGRGLDVVISGLTQPVLGICLGLQLLCTRSEEADTRCLGVFPEIVRRFPPGEKIPHIGWNTITGLRGPLFDGVADGSHVYFVHGFHADLGDETTARSDYIVPFSAGLSRGNFHAVQFHPEKSGETGARILANFLAV